MDDLREQIAEIVDEEWWWPSNLNDGYDGMRENARKKADAILALLEPKPLGWVECNAYRLEADSGLGCFAIIDNAVEGADRFTLTLNGVILVFCGKDEKCKDVAQTHYRNQIRKAQGCAPTEKE